MHAVVYSKTNFQTNAQFSLTRILENLTNHLEESILILNSKIIEHLKNYEHLRETSFSCTRDVNFLLLLTFI